MVENTGDSSRHSSSQTRLPNIKVITVALNTIRDCISLIGAKASEVGRAEIITQFAKGIRLAEANTSTP